MVKRLKNIEEGRTNRVQAALLSWLCKLDFNKYFENAHFDYWAKKVLCSYLESKHDFECMHVKPLQ